MLVEKSTNPNVYSEWVFVPPSVRNNQRNLLLKNALSYFLSVKLVL